MLHERQGARRASETRRFERHDNCTPAFISVDPFERRIEVERADNVREITTEKHR